MKCAVDVIVADAGRILLVKRKNDPFKGMWALPGGFVEESESVEGAAVREVREETGLEVQLQSLVGVFSAPNRDPRGRVVSVVFSAVPTGGRLEGGDETEDVKWFSPGDLPELAFDHAEMIKKFVGYGSLL